MSKWTRLIGKEGDSKRKKEKKRRSKKGRKRKRGECRMKEREKKYQE